MLVFDQLKRGDRQLQVMSLCVLLGMGLLVAGLWQVQVVSHHKYTANLENQMFRSVRLPALRGKILDRRGQPLVENQPRYTVNLYLEELSKLFQNAYAADLKKRGEELGRKLTRPEKAELARESRFLVASNLAQTVAALIRQPATLSEAQFRAHYEQRLALPLPIASSLKPEQIARFVEKSASLPGVELEIQPVRSYPQGDLAAHILGYLHRDDSSAADEDAFFNYRLPDYRGEIGIEGAFDSELRGKAGGKSVLVNNLGYRQAENIWSATQPGRNITLTIDARIQKAAEAALRSGGAGLLGTAIVLDAQNGDVLASASAPSFEPSAWLNGVTREEWARLSDNTLRPMINRATQERYPPGSIFKIIVALAALEAGWNTNEVVFNPGSFTIGRRHIHDTAPVGNHDFRSAFKYSSNCYFIRAGLRIGPRNIIAMSERFHLGERTGILPRQEVAGELPDLLEINANWFDGQTANISIGQGPITVTPLQMAVMTAAVANGGKVFWPRLVSKIQSPDPGAAEPPVEFPAGRLRSELGVQPHNLEIIRDAMLADVEEGGTGKRAFVPGMNVCGKTGTAEVEHGSRVVRKDTWFVSFAPFENPRYVVVVMVEGGGSGGGTCAPIARQIYEAIQKLERTTAASEVAGNF